MTTGPHDEQPSEAAVEEDLKWPLGFITLLVLAGLYLLWRFAQLGVRFFEWAF